MNANQAFEAGMIPSGHYVVCDPTGRVVRITHVLTGFSATTYQVQNGRLVWVC